MPILQHHVDDLKIIYGKHTGETLTDAEAWEMAVRLVNLFRLLLDSNDKTNRNNTNDKHYGQQ